MASRLGLNLIRNGPVSRLPVRQLSTEVTRYQDNLPSKQEIDEKVTHTGQRYPLDDFRRVRFENARRLVNEKFAIDLIKEDPIVVCDARVVCSSSGGPLGHPKIYINLDKNEVHDCGYSGRRFIKKKFYDPAKHGKSITYEEYWNDMIKKETESV